MWSKMLRKHDSDNQRDNPRSSAAEGQARPIDYVVRPPENSGAPPSPRLRQLRADAGICPSRPEATSSQHDSAEVPDSTPAKQRDIAQELSSRLPKLTHQEMDKFVDTAEIELDLFKKRGIADMVQMSNPPTSDHNHLGYNIHDLCAGAQLGRLPDSTYW